MSMTLREALRTMMSEEGEGLLRWGSARFVGLMTDLIDNESVETNILYGACNDAYLRIFADAAARRTPEALEAACTQGYNYLKDGHGTDAYAAYNVSWQLAQGIADFYGLRLQPSQAMPQADAGVGSVGGSDKPYTVNVVPQGTVGNVGSQGSYAQRPSSWQQGRGASTYGAQQPWQTSGTQRMAGSQQPWTQGSQPSAMGGGSWQQGSQSSFPAPPDQVMGPPADGRGAYGGYDTVDPQVGVRRTSRVLVVVVSVLAAIALGMGGFLAYRLITSRDDGPPDPSEAVYLSFNANDADAGSVDSIPCRRGDAVRLPDEGTLVRYGHVFVGWGLTSDDDRPMLPNARFTISENTTLYAIWRYDEEGLLDALDVREEQDLVPDETKHGKVIFVYNGTGVSCDIGATFDFVSSSGEVLESKSDKGYAVRPGDTVMLSASLEASGVQKVRYALNAQESPEGSESIQSVVTADITSSDGGSLRVRLTNTSDRMAHVTDLVVYGYDAGDEGDPAYVYLPKSLGDEGELAPGESREIRIAPWQKYDNVSPDVYLYGRMGD